ATDRARRRRAHRAGCRARHQRQRAVACCTLPARGLQAAVASAGVSMTEGVCKPGFERVAEAFNDNFKNGGEVGASVCLTVGGETVVDLWGGVADRKTARPWARDTISIVFSCTKGATAFCAHVLASRGKLDLHAP